MLTENDIYFEPFETGKAGFHGSDVKEKHTETVICEMYERETSILAPIDNLVRQTSKENT